MKAYLWLGAAGAVAVTWLFSGATRGSASADVHVMTDVALRGDEVAAARPEAAVARVEEPPTAGRRSIRIVYPAPYGPGS